MKIEIIDAKASHVGIFLNVPEGANVDVSMKGLDLSNIYRVVNVEQRDLAQKVHDEIEALPDGPVKAGFKEQLVEIATSAAGGITADSIMLGLAALMQAVRTHTGL